MAAGPVKLSTRHGAPSPIPTGTSAHKLTQPIEELKPLTLGMICGQRSALTFWGFLLGLYNKVETF